MDLGVPHGLQLIGGLGAGLPPVGADEEGDVVVRDQVLHLVQLEEGEKILVYQDRKAIQIRQLLKKYNGSREKVAAAMGISKTTLWRYMKKNGIID